MYLDLDENQISDIAALGNLTYLFELYLWENQISDISPLSNLVYLMYLDLDENQITDITALGNLTNLIQLALWDNQVSDISPLSNLANLIYLDLDENQISDITALGNLTSLTVLYLWDNQISDIPPLSKLTKLIFLDMCENQIGNITALGNLTSLIGLDLCGNQISDTSPLASLTGLAYLDLCENQISDINAMGNLASLYNLYLCDNQISDILPLVQNNGLDEGDTVDLEENPLSSTSINEYIPQLEQRGVWVWWTVPPAPTPYFPPVYVPAAPTPTPEPTPEPTPVPTVEPCNWTGTWNTNWNTMVLVQTGGQVTGTYEYEGGRIVGVVSGNTLRGTWLEAPSYSPPDDGGDFEFTISSDCSSFTGNWRYGSTGDWEEAHPNSGWTGDRVSSSITTPTPVPMPTPAPTPSPAGRVMDLSDIVREDGQALHDINFVTSDGLVRLSIGEFAIIRTQDNQPLAYIGAEACVGPFLAPLPKYHIVGSVYEFVPDGATFEPSLGVTMSYNHTWLPEKVAEEELIIGYYDMATGQWALLPSLVDIEHNTVTAQINHFTRFAILGKEVTATAPLNVFFIIGPALAALIMIGVLLYILFAGKKRTRTVH
jgi:internalin A